MKNLAPIILFVYNRPWHTRQTVEALQKNELARNSELFIFSDGPKNQAAVENVQEVRSYVRTISGFKNISIIEREKNWGLADSIIDGVTRIVNEHGRVIVLEDDIVTSKYFLAYMNDALEKYSGCDQVMSVSGYNYPIDDNTILDKPFFFRQPSSWGWATWAQSWAYFQTDIHFIISQFNDEKKYRFNIDGTYNFYNMIEMQTKGMIDSWAIRWYASIYLNNGLCLYPSKSLVSNIGADGSGIHCGNNITFDVTISQSHVEKLPDEIIESEIAVKKIMQFFLSKSKQMYLKHYLINTERIINKTIRLALKALKFLYLIINALCIRFFFTKNLPGQEFDNFARKLSITFLIKRDFAHFVKLLCNPVSIVRYFEFPFVHEAVDWNLANKCLDISSPRLLFVYLLKRYPGLFVDIINPDTGDLKETEKFIKAANLHGRTNIHNIDATRKLPFPDDYFDIITSVSVFEHMSKDGDKHAMQEAWRVLKPKGKLILTFPCSRNSYEEFCEKDVYGLSKGSKKEKYFFQRIYDRNSIDRRLSDPINTKPLYLKYFGEKKAGFYNSYVDRWILDGLKETIKDPYYISRNFTEYQEINDMPGLGVCGLIFQKESLNE